VSVASPGIVLVDRHGAIHLATVTAARLLGAEATALRGRPLVACFEFDVLAEDPETAAAQWELVLAGAQSPGGELLSPRTRPDGPRLRLGAEAVGEPDDGYCLTLVPVVAASAGSGSATGPASALEVWREHARVGFFDLDFAAGIFHYSPGWKRQLGYQDEELDNTHDSWRRLIHPDDSAAAPDQVGRKNPGAMRAFDVEYRLQHRRGHWIWLQGVGVQVFHPDGTLARAVGVQLDITERKELEEEALLNDERWLAVTTSAGLATFDVDFTADTVWVSPTWGDLTGDPAEPATPAELAASLPEAATIGLAVLLGEAADSPRATTLRPAAGDPRPVTLHAEARRSRSGAVQRVIGYVIPAAATAAPSPAPLGALEAVHEGVILADTAGCITHLNTAAERLTGQDREAVRGRPLDTLWRLVTAQEGRPAPDALEVALAAEEGPPLVGDHALDRGDGATPRPIVWTARHLAGEDGAPTGLVVVFRDPQEMTLTPEELIRTNRFDSLGVLAGAIAHDFNNILTTVLGGISQAKDNRDYANLGDAEEACLAAKALTRQLLAFAKGTPAGTRQVVPPDELLRDAARIAASGSPARVEFDLEADTRPVEVTRGQMLQVFQNLIVNAIQAMPDPSAGLIRLSCAAQTLAEGELAPLPAGDYVRFEVADNGAGIPPEILNKIFEPFFTTKKTGTGLGLATVLSIVRKHGGQLGVESEVGVGTTFTAYLPVTDRPLQVAARRAAALRFGTGRILFMDDDPKISEITGNMLKSLDYTYDLAKNGEEALALYRKYLNVNRPYDAVIMDLTIIGGMGGEECFRELKKLDPDVRAILSSGYDNDELVQRCLEMGFSGYLTKPYRVGDLGRVLKTILG
jgi:two-component system, cell cycle sensor histidine kinase and response regulator CckA